MPFQPQKQCISLSIFRDDIPCGGEDCGNEDCAELYKSELHLERASKVTLLSGNPVSKTSAADFKHYVVIDSNVALEQVGSLSSLKVSCQVLRKT